MSGVVRGSFGLLIGCVTCYICGIGKTFKVGIRWV
jgi:hypothetical protein